MQALKLFISAKTRKMALVMFAWHPYNLKKDQTCQWQLKALQENFAFF